MNDIRLTHGPDKCCECVSILEEYYQQEKRNVASCQEANMNKIRQWQMIYEDTNTQLIKNNLLIHELVTALEYSCEHGSLKCDGLCDVEVRSAAVEKFNKARGLK